MLGELIREHRRRAGLTQEELAARAGIGVRTLRDIEARRIPQPRASTVRLLAQALNLTDDERDRLRSGSGPQPVGTAPAAEGAARVERWAPPAALPRDVPAFTGRADLLHALTAIVGDGDGVGAATTGPLVVLCGPAGVGKTTVAVHWAHSVAARFPDGQLYADLHGFGAEDKASDPTDVLASLLRHVGVPTARIPGDLAGRAALYRGALAGRRVLVVLDNARDADQVRPLLPAAPGCLALVTSRNQLVGLSATDGAHLLTVDLLPPDQARELLTARLGRARVAGQRAAVDEIVARCAGLPLALAVVAARAASRPAFPLDAVGQQLDAAAGLDGLDAGDSAADVRSVLSWSHRRLRPAAARLFRLLSLHPGPDIGVAAVAGLLGIAPQVALALLAELAVLHLVDERQPGRYSLHDLLRVYGAELMRVDDCSEREAALTRLLDHYLHSADAASRALEPHRELPTLPDPAPAAQACAFPDERSASAWFAAEYPVLHALVVHAAQTAGRLRYTWQIGCVLTTYLQRCGHWYENLAVQRSALEAARRGGDPEVQARAHRDLARACFRPTLVATAITHLEHAADLSARHGDLLGLARAHHGLGFAHGLRGEHAAAIRHGVRAVELFGRIGHEAGLGSSLNSLGWSHALRSDHQESVRHCRAAIVLLQRIGNRHDEAEAYDTLGYAYQHLGRYQEAAACYLRAIALFRLTGDRYQEADSLLHLADACAAGGDDGAASRLWRDTLPMLRQVGHPDADRVNRRLPA